MGSNMQDEINNEVPGPRNPPERKGLEEIYKALDERDQESRLDAPSESMLAEIDSEVLREREREFRDVEKHWVRKNGWLRIVKEIAAKKSKVLGKPTGIRYLTLPGYYRLDVSLLLQNHLIEVTEADDSGNPKEIYVAGFEAELTKFGRMETQMPKLKLFGAAKLEDALISSRNKYYLQLKNLFPFDAINMDLTTSLTPRHEGPYSPTLKAIETIFQLQSGNGLPWALFLTFRNVHSEWETGAFDQLTTNLQSNLVEEPRALEAFQKLYNRNRVDELRDSDPINCISQAVAKWLIDRAHAYGFTGTLENCYFYTRYNTAVPYSIYKHLMVFSRAEVNPAQIPTKTIPKQAWMSNDLVEAINRHRPLDVERKLLEISDRAPNSLLDLKEEINSLCKLVH